MIVFGARYFYDYNGAGKTRDERRLIFFQRALT